MWSTELILKIKHHRTNIIEPPMKNGHWVQYSRRPFQMKVCITLLMLVLFLPNAQEGKDLWKSPKSCHVGIHLKALVRYEPMNKGFSHFSDFCQHIILTKLAISSKRVKPTHIATKPAAWELLSPAWRVSQNISKWNNLKPPMKNGHWVE